MTDSADKNNQMTTTMNTSSATGSTLTATVSTPLIGDEYVLVKKTTPTKESKEEKRRDVSVEAFKLNSEAIGLGKNNFSSGGGRFGACKALLTYDFSITNSSSGALVGSIALAPNQDSFFTSYWRPLFTAMTIDKAEVEFNFTEYINSVGHDFALSAVVIGYKAMSSATPQAYADVSDYKSAITAAYSTARPVIKYRVPNKWLIGWNLGVEASTVDLYTSRWTSTQFTTATQNMGIVHIASQKAMFDTERKITGRLKMWMSFKGQL